MTANELHGASRRTRGRSLVGSITITGCHALEESPVMWDDRPSVNRFPDRLKSIEDSQLLLGFLMAGAGGDVTRDAVRADISRKTEKALELWQEEWEKRRWNRFAAFRIADLLVETDRLDEALEHIDMLSDLWPESDYVRHLEQQMTSVIRLLDRARWVRPTSARASRNSPAAADSLFAPRDVRCSASSGTGVHHGWNTHRCDPSDWSERGHVLSVALACRKVDG